MAVMVDPDRGLASVKQTAAFSKRYLQGILAIFLPKNHQKILVKTPCFIFHPTSY
jgi:hypothetical protein